MRAGFLGIFVLIAVAATAVVRTQGATCQAVDANGAPVFKVDPRIRTKPAARTPASTAASRVPN